MDAKFCTGGGIGERVHFEVNVGLEGHEGVDDTPHSLLKAWIHWNQSVTNKTEQI